MSRKLENIGFYTLCDARAAQTSDSSPLWRCELLLTDRCNFKCPYCIPLREDCRGDLPFDTAQEVVTYWANNGLKHIRFSGGEPTVYKYLPQLIQHTKSEGIKRIALSTNGSRKLDYYKHLIELGVNDFSISLDACCASYGLKMAGGINAWDRVVENIREISRLIYVTVGMVFTEDNIGQAKQSIEFASSLGAADIRIISAAQYNKKLDCVNNIDPTLLDRHPILAYRVRNYQEKRNVRGISVTDCSKCYLVLDDMAIAGNYHFPCIIYLRQKGEPIGKVCSNLKNIRAERAEWFKTHNCYEDPICKSNCLDVCVDYNNEAKRSCKFK